MESHAGSWTNPFTGKPLTDRGWTEKITDALGYARTAAGGSDLVLDQYQNPNTAYLDKSGGYQLNPQQQARAASAYGTPQVLGTNDNGKKTNTGTPQNNNTPGGNINKDNLSQYFPGYAGWDPNVAWQDYQATGGAGKSGGAGGNGGYQDISQLISDAYAPALGALGQIETGLGEGKTSAIGNVEKDYTSGQETIGREQKELEEALGQQGRSLEKSGQSAYSEAIRNLNSLFQTMASRFGAGSSTGGAAGEIIGQEFLRNQGKMREQLETGRQSLAAEGTKLKNYITDKVGQLDSWKRDAIQKIDENFRNQMAEIALRRGEVEANKTNARIAALQDAVQRARDIEDRERDFKSGLAQFAVETMQNVSGRAFSPQEIAGVVNDMLGQELNTFSSRTAPAGPGFSYNPSALRGRTEDEIRKAGVLS